MNLKFKLMCIVMTVVLVGCSLASVMAHIAAYLPVAENAFAGIIQILVADGVITTATQTALTADQAKVNASFADVQTAVQAYQTAEATAQPGKLQQVVNALQAVESEQLQFEKDLGVNTTSKDVATVNAAIDLAVGTFDGFSAQIGIQPSQMVRTVRADSIVYSSGLVMPRASSSADFKRKYNKLMVSGGHPEQQLKLSLAEKLHLTSK